MCKKAIESVLAQSYKDYELIIVDDASKDGTEEMVASFKDDRIRYIKRNKNFGTDTKPKNEGIQASKHELIAFLDSDNQFRPDHLAVLMEHLTDGYDGVYGDRWVTDLDNRFNPRLGQTGEFNPTLLLRKNYIDTSDVLIRRSALFAVGGFDERYKKYVDWNLWLRMAKAGMRLKHVPIIITDYHTHPDMKSETVKDRNADNSPSVPLGSTKVFHPEWDAFDLEIHLPYLGPVKLPKVAVYTITYNRLEYTKQCFESLYQTAGYDFYHYIVDNGSTDGTREWLEETKNKQALILNPDNKGISIASNQIVEKLVGKYDIIVKVDNDCMFLTDGWLKKMVEIYNSNHLLALSCYVQGLQHNPGGSPRIGYGQIRGELLGMTKHLGGICHFVGAKAYQNFKWDEDAPLHGVQDLEFSQHLLHEGYQMGYLENYFCNHGPAGTEAQKTDYPKYFKKRVLEKVNTYEKNRQA
jgi:glycosyltransferase involved in cell wall biosynthesis